MSFLTADERAALEAALPGWLPQQRWFATKDQPVRSVYIVGDAWLDRDLGIALVEVERRSEEVFAHRHRFGNGSIDLSTDLYTLPLRRDDQGTIADTPFADAADDPAWWRAWLTRFGLIPLSKWRDEAEEIALPPFRLRFSSWEKKPPAALRLLEDTAAVRVVGKEASNASVLVQETPGGRWLFAKLQRRILFGPSPELYRLRVVGSSLAAKPVAECSLRIGADPRHTALPLVSLVTTAFPDAEEAWARLLRLLAQRDVRHALQLSTSTGRATKHMHNAFASELGGWLFVHDTLDEIRSRWWRLFPERELPSLDVYNPSRGAEEREMPIHGDLHLGQMLVLPSGQLRIIDFGGEPGRGGLQPSPQGSPVRDVAGMLRSFDYAVCSALPETERADVRAKLEAAFLRGYEAVPSSTPNAWPTLERLEKLLRLYLVQKTLYEIQYERAYRPDWAWIPEQALERLLADDASDDTLSGSRP